MALLINGERVEDEEIAREAQSMRQSFDQIPVEVREGRGLDASHLERHLWEWSRENVIERTVLRQEAAKDDEPVPTDVVDAALEKIKKDQRGEGQVSLSRADDNDLRAEIEVRIHLDRLIGRITAKVKPPKNKDVAEYYRKHREQFHVPETVHAAHIVKNVDENTTEEQAREAITQIAAELSNGGTFEELADKHSDCPGNGGDLGAFPRGQMVDEFDEVVFVMKANEISPVFRTPFGFHIVKVYETKAAHMRSLSEAGADVREAILERKKTKAVEDFVDRLKARAAIEDVVSNVAEIVATQS